MDTLIDNRNFPPEMQEHNQKQKPKTLGGYFLLIFIGFVIVGFLIYVLFIKSPKPLVEQTPLITEEVKANIIQLQQTTPAINSNTEEQDRKVKAFFN